MKFKVFLLKGKFIKTEFKARLIKSGVFECRLLSLVSKCCCIHWTFTL